jgi:hypothetical protein
LGHLGPTRQPTDATRRPDRQLRSIGQSFGRCFTFRPSALRPSDKPAPASIAPNHDVSYRTPRRLLFIVDGRAWIARRFEKIVANSLSRLLRAVHVTFHIDMLKTACVTDPQRALANSSDLDAYC